PDCYRLDRRSCAPASYRAVTVLRGNFERKAGRYGLHVPLAPGS
ncbi:MAG: hypothetical protein ACI8W7_000609, partial [Gammaproteobacteria bacterium]